MKVKFPDNRRAPNIDTIYPLLYIVHMIDYMKFWTQESCWGRSVSSTFKYPAHFQKLPTTENSIFWAVLAATGTLIPVSEAYANMYFRIETEQLKTLTCD